MKARRHLLILVEVFVISAIVNGSQLEQQSQALAAAGSVTLDGSMGSSGPIGAPVNPLPDGSTPNYHIPYTVGQSRGNNLFHSFGQFNIGSSETVTFTSPSTTANIIARVTGGASTIDGTIRSMIDGTPNLSGANIFLLNPAGILFGPNAALDLGGSFHASSADYLKFENGEKFYSNRTDISVLSVAEPSAFGFLSSSPAPISGDKAFLRVSEGKTLSLVGGDITYQGYPLSTDPTSPDFVLYALPMLAAPNGRINLASLASAGEVALADLSTGSAKLGKISLTDGVKLDVTNQDSSWYPLSSGGTVVIRGGEMIFRNGGIDAYGNPGGVIDIKGDSLHLDGFYLFPANFNWNYDPAYADISHPGSAIKIDLSGDLLMTHSSSIDTQNLGAGKGGDISIKANNIRLGDDVLDDRSWTGSDLAYYGYIAAQTYIGAGDGGNIDITAHNGLTIQNGFYVGTRTLADGKGGNVQVHADTLEIRDKGNLSVEATGTGRGGNLDVTARVATFSAAHDSLVENVSSSSGIDALTAYYSDGGKITLTADTLNLVDGGVIATALLGDPEINQYATGHGADVEINAKKIAISGYVNSVYLSGIDARVVGADAEGTGGNITVITDSLSLSNAGAIRSGLFNNATGNAGNITIDAKTVDIATRGQIYADSFRGTGNSGNISVNATTMNVTGANQVPHPADLDSNIFFTGLSTTTNAGTGGKITVALAGNLTTTEGGGIKADTKGTGSGGAIDVSALNVQLGGAGTAINALSADAGNAGNIIIKTGQFSLASGSNVTTQTLSSGAGGTVTVTADSLNLSDSGQITSSAAGSGKAGTIGVTLTGDLTASSSGGISADSKAAGAGGSITVDAKNVILKDKGTFDASASGSGNAGDISVKTSGNVWMSSGGAITTSTTGPGTGGNITVVATTLDVASASQISSSSSSSGNAGNINVTAGNQIQLRDSSITSEAVAANGGEISLNARAKINLINSAITAKVQGDAQTVGGKIFIDPQFVVMKNSTIDATAIDGRGGTIRIVADTFLADPQSSVIAYSQKGISGTVDIQAPVSNISGFVSPLSSDYVSAETLLRERCIARIREGKYSSFVIGGRDGLPLEPGNMLPGLLF